MRSLLDVSSFFFFSNSNNPSSSLEGSNTGLRRTFLKRFSVGDGGGGV